MASSGPDTLTVCRASAGTGKTYTLAANYVALLLSGESYRSILAVTFTNKATQEMKDRILLFLDNIAANTGRDADNALKAVRERMIANRSASDDELRRLARDTYNRMLEDYDNIHISTIDTFLIQLLNGLGQMLDDASAGAAIELDLEHLITVAVDNLLTRPTDENDFLSTFIGNYVTEQLNAGKDWDIRGTLIKIAQLLYSESVQQLDAEGKIIFDAKTILRYKDNVDWKQAPEVAQLRRAYAPWSGWTAASEGIGTEKELEKFINEIGTYLDGTCEERYMFRGITPSKRKAIIDEGGVAFKAKFKSPARAEEVHTAFVQLQELCLDCQRVYNTCQATTALLSEMALMTALRLETRALLIEQNRVLLAQTADKLHRAMSLGDADFILEKAGIRYRHIMLDEFQDTSILQWENFKPLLEEILANGGTVFIVGDIKQSIYRWRNGDWTIMRDLNAATPVLGPYFHDMPLRRNFRSSEQVVKFNLELFQTLASQGYANAMAAELYDEQYGQYPLADFFRSGHNGGYVQLAFTLCDKSTGKDAQARIMEDMFSVIESRLQLGDEPEQILILVRGNAQAQQIMNHFQALAPASPYLSKTQIVSCDSFNLETSLSVQFVIQSLRHICLKDQVAKTYLQLVFPTFDLTRLDTVKSATPLSELVEELVKLLPSQPIPDLAYVNALLDGVHDFVAQYGADTAAFLAYWSDTLRLRSIAAPTANAIRIMTIHSAKGLEAKNVFVPFCTWEMEDNRSDSFMWTQAKAPLKQPVDSLQFIPVRMSSSLENSAYEPEYLEDHTMQRLDNLNLLYVALTRAGENLYVYGDMMRTELNTNKSVASLIYRAFEHNWTLTDDTYFLAFGSPTTPQLTAAPQSGAMIDRFSFVNAPTRQAEMHIGERPVVFQMSREALDSLHFGAESEERNARIDLGIVCHSIMEHIETRADQDAAINDARVRGLIADDETEREITRLINAAWTNTQMVDWFSGGWELLREAAFLTANGEQRPDRVMIDRATSTAIVLDYKFGQREAKYTQQVREYMRIMAQLNFRHVEGYLWYAQEATLQPVKL
ncbi:MAG: UvrD-helicase domain-containing protein [Paludibacteraceae bacterium]|nr:UvrD-helicase domain-containing protein [Paludibacteraceae bacterium]